MKPMLAATMEDITQVSWPKLWSPKLDGVRCLIIDGVAMSRNLKPIRNEYVQATLGKKKLNGLDGELIVSSATGEGVFNRTQSGVMKQAGKPDFRFFVFDDFSVAAHGFSYRLGRAEDRVEDAEEPRLVHVTHGLAESAAGLRVAETATLKQGYEGVMLRSLNGLYKEGRATEREDTLWKVKRFRDGEAMVYGIEEGTQNTNEATKDELGRTKRSTHKAGLVPNGLVGTLLCRDLATGEQLRVAPGRMTGAARALYMQQPKLLLKKVIKYKDFAYGVKDLGRFPTFQSILHPDAVPIDLTVHDTAPAPL